jgi:cell division protein FtsL
MARVVALPQNPARERPHRRQPELVLVKSPTRAARTRNLRKVLVFITVVVLLAMVVVARIAIELEESSIGQLGAEITQAQRTHEDLKLEAAQLSSPQRIMSYASQHLHLTLPSSVDVVAGSHTKNAVPLPQPEATAPSLPLPAGEVVGGN